MSIESTAIKTPLKIINSDTFFSFFPPLEHALQYAGMDTFQSVDIATQDKERKLVWIYFDVVLINTFNSGLMRFIFIQVAVHLKEEQPIVNYFMETYSAETSDQLAFVRTNDVRYIKVTSQLLCSGIA